MGSEDPSLGGVSTILGLVLTASRPDEKGMEARRQLVERYHRPVARTLRKRGTPRDRTEDLTQEFMLRFIQGAYLAGYDASQGKFRFWLKACLRLFVAQQEEHESYRRGEPLQQVAESAIAEPIDDRFDLEWASDVWNRMQKEMRRRLAGEPRLRSIWTWDSHSTSAGKMPHAEVAAKFGMSLEAFRAALYKTRDIRGAVFSDILREGVTDPRDLPAEMEQFLRLINRGLSPRENEEPLTP